MNVIRYYDPYISWRLIAFSGLYLHKYRGGVFLREIAFNHRYYFAFFPPEVPEYLYHLIDRLPVYRVVCVCVPARARHNNRLFNRARVCCVYTESSTEILTRGGGEVWARTNLGCANNTRFFNRYSRMYGPYIVIVADFANLLKYTRDGVDLYLGRIFVFLNSRREQIIPADLRRTCYDLCRKRKTYWWWTRIKPGHGLNSTDETAVCNYWKRIRIRSPQ